MKIKEYATERIKDIQEFLKEDGIEESIRRNNYSVIEILEYIEDMCMAEVKETLVGKMLKVWKIGGSNEERKGIRDRN